MRKKTIAMVLSLALVACLGVAGALAWLTDSDQATNTFTVGNIDIELDESKVDPATGQPVEGERVLTNENAYKMVPGRELFKDPIVTVKGGSENCWLFVKVEKSTAPKVDDYMSFEMSTVGDSASPAWEALEGVDGVYYRPVESASGDQLFEVIKNDEVLVKSTVTKEMMDALATSGTNPTLTFKAYAIQKEGFDTAKDAWSELVKANK